MTIVMTHDRQDSQLIISPAGDLYLDLMARCLTDWIYDRSNDSARKLGYDWPERGHTMVGFKRLANIRYCCEKVIADCIPGDFVECGVWRGGACIFMRAILKVYGIEDRTVYCCDTFDGFPEPDLERYPQDARFHAESPVGQVLERLKVSLEEVVENFARYGFLKHQLAFVLGPFHESLPNISTNEIAVLRLDGDMYGSTMDSLLALYDKVPPGGFVIVDDYLNVPECRQAVRDFHEQRQIIDRIEAIDHIGAFWRKS